MGGDAAFEQLGLARGEQAEFVRLGQAGSVDGEEDVGRAVGAFVLQPLEQFVFLALDAVDLDPGLLGEVAVQRFVGLVVAGRVEVQHLFLGGGGTADQQQAGDGQTKFATHGFLQMSL